MPQIVVNALLEWINLDGRTFLERVLWVSQVDDLAVVIKLPADGELPRNDHFKRIYEALERCECRILSQDPFIHVVSDEAASSDANQERVERAWNAIGELKTLGPTAMFDSRLRGQWMTKQVQTGQFTKPSLYKILRRYWEGGQTRHALFPRFDRSGGRGQERMISSSQKRGRPRKPGLLKKRLPGINVDESIRKRLVAGAKEFYESSEGLTLRKAYKKTLEKYFNEGYEESFAGDLVPILPHEEMLPTYMQFRYCYKKDKGEVRATKARAGEREFLLKSRALLGNATTRAFGPGSQFQIDSTIVDLNLVSSLDATKIPGRPVLFVVIDAFSRMVVGFSVSFENASWRAAILALENVVTDKASFCRELGIPGVTSDMWPSSHLPAEILADRGEFKGHNSNFLVDAFGVQVSTTAPYRADWKPFVERHFRLINDRLLTDLPGTVRKKIRGTKDTRLDAVIGLKALRRILAIDFINYNNNAVIKEYPLDQDMVIDGIRAQPIELWNWGLQNRTGAQRSFPVGTVRNILLPRGNASVTARGLRFKGLYFKAEILERLEWFSRARIRGVDKRIVSYDPIADSVEVFLHASYSREPELREAMIGIVNDVGLIPCRVIEHRGFEGSHSWYELEHEMNIKQERNQQARQESAPDSRAWEALSERIVAEEAVKTAQAHAASGPIPKSVRTKGIRENRTAERTVGRQEYAAQNSDAPAKAPTVKPSSSPIFHDSVDQKLRAIIKSKIASLRKEEK